MQGSGRFCITVGCAVAACLLGSGAAIGAEIVVLPDGTGDVPTIAAALALAEPGDTVRLGPGVFTGDGSRDLVVSEAITIEGAGRDATTIACDGSADAPHRGFTIVEMPGSGEAEIASLTIRGGYATSGGAIHIGDAARLRLTSVRCEDNEATSHGGGVYLLGLGSLWATDCELLANRASSGAGISCGGLTTVDLQRCVIAWNDGQGLRTSNSVVSLWRCTVVGNVGGGLMGTNAGWMTLEAVQCVVAFNDGPSFTDDPDHSVVLACCCVHGNTGGDWTASVSEWAGVAGNIGLDPLFCSFDPDGGAEADLGLLDSSPCRSGSPPNPECATIGCFDVGCGAVPVETISWEELRRRFR